jgi:two-component system sensor histidine kinase UhpB
MTPVIATRPRGPAAAVLLCVIVAASIALGAALTLAFPVFGCSAASGGVPAAAPYLAACAAASVLAALALYVAYARAAARASVDRSRDETRMMSIVRASTEAIITIDDAQNIVNFNPMAERVFGVPAADALGTSLSRFIPERFRAVHAQHVERFGATGVSERQMGKQLVLFGLRANGDEFPLEASISQIRDGGGKLYTVILRDITERVRADGALKQSREELRELSANLQRVREMEKTRIARELHDDLGQQLSVLKIDLATVGQALLPLQRAQPATPLLDRPLDPLVAGVPLEQALVRLNSMSRLIDTTVASLRRIAADLRPVMLDDLGLSAAIDWLTHDFTYRHGIRIEHHIEPEDSFTAEAATAIFRIVQEALSNVARHADASHVRLRLTTGADDCVLQVADNGRGAQHRIDEPDAKHKADKADETDKTAESRHARDDRPFGLLGIRERAHMLGGVVNIDTAKDQGFTLTVSFPRHAVQQQENHS